MHIFISIFMAIAPSLALVYYYYRQDLKKPEPKGLITRIFFLGIVFTLPAVLLEIVFDEFFGFALGNTLLFELVKAFAIAAFLEESIKLLVVKLFVYNHIHFDEVMDGIVYAIMASLGFACMENIIYVIDGGLAIALVRAFTAVPMHALASGTMGYYIGKAKFSYSKSRERSLIFKGLWYAVFIHGLYDFFLFASPKIGMFFAVGVFPLLIITFIKLKTKIALAIAEDHQSGRN